MGAEIRPADGGEEDDVSYDSDDSYYEGDDKSYDSDDSYEEEESDGEVEVPIKIDSRVAASGAGRRYSGGSTYPKAGSLGRRRGSPPRGTRPASWASPSWCRRRLIARPPAKNKGEARRSWCSTAIPSLRRRPKAWRCSRKRS